MSISNKEISEVLVPEKIWKLFLQKLRDKMLTYQEVTVLTWTLVFCENPEKGIPFSYQDGYKNTLHYKNIQESLRISEKRLNDILRVLTRKGFIQR